jgi:hypothetical protein
VAAVLDADHWGFLVVYGRVIKTRWLLLPDVSLLLKQLILVIDIDS